MKRLLSGVKPTGRPHIGNYFGAMKQFVDQQDNYQNLIFVANYHALTKDGKYENFSQDTLDLVIDYLAIGLEPKKNLIYLQSDIPEVTELAWYFGCLTTMPYLMRAHAFKDAEAKNKEINAGVFNYPVLMAADILIVDADIVPVGRDQKQHIEISRDLAQKFNNQYGETFKSPKELILENVETVPGIDGQKMSKSYNNTIPLFASDEELHELVAKIPTDSKSVEEPKNPDENNIFKIHKLFLSLKTDAESAEKKVREQYLNGGLSYKQAKEMLLQDMIEIITPFRERRKKIAANPQKVIKMLQKNQKKIRKIVEPKIKEIRQKIDILNA